MDRYGQLIEPMGLWVTMGHNGKHLQTDGHMTVVHMTRSIKPLIVKAVTGTGKYAGINATKAWKLQLSERYNGAVGVELTRAILADGYTAVVTVDERYETGEIVLLNVSKEELAALQRR